MSKFPVNHDHLVAAAVALDVLCGWTEGASDNFLAALAQNCAKLSALSGEQGFEHLLAQSAGQDTDARSAMLGFLAKCVAGQQSESLSDATAQAAWSKVRDMTKLLIRDSLLFLDAKSKTTYHKA